MLVGRAMSTAYGEQRLKETDRSTGMDDSLPFPALLACVCIFQACAFSSLGSGNVHSVPVGLKLYIIYSLMSMFFLLHPILVVAFVMRSHTHVYCSRKVPKMPAAGASSELAHPTT